MFTRAPVNGKGLLCHRGKRPTRPVSHWRQGGGDELDRLLCFSWLQNSPGRIMSTHKSAYQPQGTFHSEWGHRRRKEEMKPMWTALFPSLSLQGVCGWGWVEHKIYLFYNSTGSRKKIKTVKIVACAWKVATVLHWMNCRTASKNEKERTKTTRKW